MRPMEFMCVLHVPDLHNNLLAILYLSQQHSIHVHISPIELTMAFSIGNKQLFVASINEDNSAFLAGSTVMFTEHTHHSTSTLPADRNLWHWQFSHHRHEIVSNIVKDKLATGMCINMWTKPNPICEPCWGTYAYMHICTKSIQIYLGIFFDFILVLLSFHCLHTVPIFSKIFPIFLAILFTSKACHFDVALLILLLFKCLCSCIVRFA